MLDTLAFGAAQLHHVHEHALALQSARAWWPRTASSVTIAGNQVPAHTIKLLISGVPGAGKTTVATHLAQRTDGHHTDLESSRRRRRPLLAGRSAQIISWGFGPHTDLAVVADLRADGYQLIWLDGDRAASYRAYMAREHGDEDAEYLYYSQMQMITGSHVVRRLNPLIVSPFAGGVFRPVDDIAEQILYLAYGWRP